jgi:hypothetical protein
MFWLVTEMLYFDWHSQATYFNVLASQFGSSHHSFMKTLLAYLIQQKQMAASSTMSSTAPPAPAVSATICTLSTQSYDTSWHTPHVLQSVCTTHSWKLEQWQPSEHVSPV